LHDQTPSLESGIPAGWRTNILQIWEGLTFFVIVSEIVGRQNIPYM
jgi:hypothetical protein